MDDDERTTGLGLWTDAREMFDASEVLLGTLQLRLSNPAYYLLGHGFELAFKAHLRSCGLSLKALRAIGHDLDRAIGVAETHGLGEHCLFDEADRLALARLNIYYMRKQFEYRVTGARQLPTPDSLLILGVRLIASIRAHCEKSIGVERGRSKAP